MPREKTREKFDKIFESSDKRTFIFLPTIDGYIFREFMVIYLCCMLTFCVLFLIGDMTSHLGDFLKPQATVLDGISFFLLKQPGELVFILPLALMLASLYTMAKMGVHSEITAMRASGISLVRCGVPIYFVALIMTGVNFWFSESFVPECNLKSRIVLGSINDPDYFRRISTMLMYRSPDNERTWMVKSFNSMNEQNDIQLKKYDSKGKIQLELYASKSHYSHKDGWVFNNAMLIKYKNLEIKGVKDYSKAYEEKTFLVQETSSLPVFDKHNPDFHLLGNIIERPSDIFDTVKQPNEITTRDIIRKLSISDNLDDLSKNTLRTELATRFAFPWVCLLAVMISIPIAGQNVKKGLVVSVVSAVGIIIVYLTISKVFIVFGSKGTIPPYIAGTLPTIILAIFAWKYLNHNK
ncbi:MAG TPA: hypothetical protein DD381_02565 [Lentisphaeria bacterium]|nr:MAG: hypothetical protein A2X47_03685 [Lentisphaerae bacterium GWF2_38_69]HBM15218.1 hypothetical protein [Lentisphaeria bacterium]